FMIGVYFRHARGNPDTSYDEIWEMEFPFLLYKSLLVFVIFHITKLFYSFGEGTNFYRDE
ncbi:hypothetical protein, partial [Leptospira santarosai]|uniref:hypothetical protein n=1 Tax=Leptospira santarosai TaxID=28183 RepID=UPI00051913DC